MGRRKPKKTKTGAGKHPSPAPQGSGSEGSPAPGAGDPSVVVMGACSAPIQAHTSTPSPQDTKQRPSPKRTIPKTAMTGTKAYQRAQIQGELSSLEAQLAAVEDLQARMAAKLSSVDSHMDIPPTAAPSTTPAAITPPVETKRPEKDSTAHPDRVQKAKKNKKSKQDKALKQQENLKEAKEMKEAANVVQKVGKEEEVVREECAVDNWEDIEQVEVVLENKDGKTELAVKEKGANMEQGIPIKQSPSSAKTAEEIQREMSVNSDVEKKIAADCDAEKDLGDMFGKELATEIAGYLMADYNRMVNLRTALDAQCQVAIINGTAVADDAATSKTRKGGPYFSYADALKSSLPQAEDGEDVCEKETHVYHYMKTEYDQCCLAKLQMEEGETLYHEAAFKRSSKSPVPRIEVSLAGTPDNSDDDGKPPETPSKVVHERAVAEALMHDYYQMNAVATSMEAEAKCQVLICATSSASAASEAVCCKSPKMKKTQKNEEEEMHSEDSSSEAIEVFTYLKDDCQRMEARHTMMQCVDSCHVGGAAVDEARHAEAVRRAAVLEAATMEVEYEGAEEQFLMQRESRRSRPWKWMRADTAPAHIDVPETVHEPVSDDAEEDPDTCSTEVLTDMHGLVFQCRDSCTQTESVGETPISHRLQVEIAQRMALEKYVHVLEQEVRDQQEKLSDQRRVTDRLEDSISDKQAEASEAKMVAAEYKSKFINMEGGMDFLAASQAQARIRDLEEKLGESTSELKILTEKLAGGYQQVDLIPMVVHKQRMKKVEDVCHDLQVKVMQLEAQLAKLNNVRDVWGTASTNNTPTLQASSGLDLGFPDLSPVPACISALNLSESPPEGDTTLTSGLLSGLSDLNNKSMPVVAPLAMEEDMDSDDDIDWTSASEYLRDSSDLPVPVHVPVPVSAAPAPVTSPVGPPGVRVGAAVRADGGWGEAEPCPASPPPASPPPAAGSLLGLAGCRSPPRPPRAPLCSGGVGGRAPPPPAAQPAHHHQLSHPIQQPQQSNQSNGSSKPKGIAKKRSRKSTK